MQDILPFVQVILTVAVFPIILMLWRIMGMNEKCNNSGQIKDLRRDIHQEHNDFAKEMKREIEMLHNGLVRLEDKMDTQSKEEIRHSTEHKTLEQYLARMETALNGHVQREAASHATLGAKVEAVIQSAAPRNTAPSPRTNDFDHK